MYLMNVPPVAATQTEWRRCGPSGGYSFPACFNDSDSELSTRGTPISDKVQMIIDSLRSTQSSLEMGNELEGNVPSGQEGHTQVGKVPVESYMEAKSKTKSPTENPQTHFSFTNNHESSDSDSDDSVDRGIEEAILEYLKEKDGHKRKAEPSSAFLHSSKIPRKSPPLVEASKHNSDINASLIPVSQFPRSFKAETPTAAAASIPLKKYIKNKAFLDENFDLNKSSAKSLVSSKEQMKNTSETTSLFNKTTKCPVTVKIEDSNDSSSDDGIEEAIQRYQLEKKELQSKSEAFNLHAFQDESDSTSDDGIEEAIRSYQLEQLKEKSGLKSFLHEQRPFSHNSLIQTVGSTSSENIKKHKLKKKRSRTENKVQSFQTHVLDDLKPKSSLLDNPKGKGNGLLSFNVDSFKELPVPAPPKVNTTAELMCAEAILDISKTVMPRPFHQDIDLNACSPNEASVQPSLPDSRSYEESNASSIDSEDGIEQEIRKFLEQKAQMHKQTPGAQEPLGVNEPEKVKAPKVTVQKKTQRLSLTQRRKQRENTLSVSNMLETDNQVNETTPKSHIGLTKESNHSTVPQKSQTPLGTATNRTVQSGDKSSSLDSDEDLDMAIKDLLKTKKKSKKKVRDMRKKSKKCIKAEEPMSGNRLPTKTLREEPMSKFGTLKKAHKGKDGITDKCRLGKKNILQLKQNDKSEEQTSEHQTEGKDTKSLHTVETAPQTNDDDSSSVDSDDSIEQEIRRFLAEKAKVSTAEKHNECRNGTVMVQDRYIMKETQQAEIPPIINNPSSASPTRSAQDKMPQRQLGSPVSPQSCSSSVQSCSPSLLEPADGAGAARNQQRRPGTIRADVADITPQMERSGPALSPTRAHSYAESIKWRQSLGLLPVSDKKATTRTIFHITSSEIRETASAAPSYPNVDHESQTHTAAWFSSRTNRAPFSCTSEAAGNATVRPTILNFFSAARQQSQMTLTKSLTPSHRSQFPLEEEKASTVHMLKDKSVFVELESNRTNHVQVQNRDSNEGKDRVDFLHKIKLEDESVKIDEEEEVQHDRKDEEFIDESDCEAGSRPDPEKKQGFSTLSLSRAIDPGITISPCIALTSDERSRILNRKYLINKLKKGIISEHSETFQHVKRKLQFVQLNRKETSISQQHHI